MVAMLRMLVAFILACTPLAPPVHAGSVVLTGMTGGDFAVRVKSLKELRFRKTVHQQYDFSCGSAALATLLTYHYEDPVNEQEIFTAMYEVGDKEKIRRDGFSLLDIKKYLEARGYKADGFKTTLDKFVNLGVPAIVLINNKGYRHFVVVKGVREAEVLIGDPAVGARKMARGEFEKSWNGLLFMIRSNRKVAANHFNRSAEWQVREKAPLGMALRPTELANLSYLLPGANDF